MPDTNDISLDLTTLRSAYAGGRLRPEDVVRTVHARIAQHAGNPVWISQVPLAQMLERAAELSRRVADMAQLPLYGVPFAVKDNIDVGGMTTTAACPGFTHVAATGATVVERLLAAGGILVGKTNLDQFATGLVGVRSPWGAVQNAFNPAFVSGGSSSGSAVAVALGMASFALGTDTAGSGRVPAAFNNLVGLKPTRGLVSTAGVLPACRTLDCVSVFALTCADADAVFGVAAAPDEADEYSRTDRAQQALPDTAFRFGVPDAASLRFFGDAEASRLFEQAAQRLAALGGTPVPVNLEPFYEAARLLYEGPWVAERHAAIREFFDTQPGAILPVIRTIIGKAASFSATDAFDAAYRLAQIRRDTAAVWRDIDFMAVPSAPTIYTIAEVEADPIQLNANLGTYTNFVNLLDLAAIALPAGFRSDGLPFGITLVAPALADRSLLGLGHRFQQAGGLPLGATGKPLPATAPAAADGTRVSVAVVGAHLSGLPLNHQLTSRGARLVRRCRTAADYRLYALPGTVPPKPGLVRNTPGSAGHAIDVEVWDLPEAQFGSFVCGIPAPLGIGTLALEDGSEVKGFICEGHVTTGARDISAFGGWRAYLDSLATPARERP